MYYIYKLQVDSYLKIWNSPIQFSLPSINSKEDAKYFQIRSTIHYIMLLENKLADRNVDSFAAAGQLRPVYPVD